jgi:programmed cell death protein 5
MDEEETQGQAENPQMKRMQQLQLEMQKKQLLRRMLTEDAYSRMMNVRMSSPELYDKVISSLAYVAQSGKATGKFSDEQIHSLLVKMTSKPETKIEFRSK